MRPTEFCAPALRVRRWIASLLIVAALASPFAGDAAAQLFRPNAEKQRLNANKVGLIVGAPGGTWGDMGADLARLLDDHAGLSLRVVVQIGIGSIKNLDDLLNLQGVDFAFVHSDALESFRGQPEIYRQLRAKMRYVARLHREEIHVLAGPTVAALRDLDGKRVSIGARGTGTQLTSKNLFAKLGVTPIIEESSTDKALDDLLAGRLDAVVFVVGKRAPVFGRIKAEDAIRSGVRFLALPHDDPALAEYVPAALTSADYPALVPSGETVPVRAVSSVLAVFAWQPGQARYQPVRRFVEKFLERAAALRGPGFRADKWCEVDLAAEVAGWERFAVAAEWLRDRQGATTRICPDCRAAFEQSMKTQRIDVDRLGSEARDSLFVAWKAGNPGAC